MKKKNIPLILLILATLIAFWLIIKENIRLQERSKALTEMVDSLQGLPFTPSHDIKRDEINELYFNYYIDEKDSSHNWYEIDVKKVTINK